jgi:hypothetical protein
MSGWIRLRRFKKIKQKNKNSKNIFEKDFLEKMPFSGESNRRSGYIKISII